MDAIRDCGRISVALGLVLVCLGLAPCSVTAAEESAAVTDADDLMELSLEDLMKIEVTTFSRKPTLLSKTPAAVFVVSQADIARSGARSIPDVLRMVPGLEVAQVDSSSWAVTSRGSNGVYANKLLVLMDGRTLYTPLYSGVYWDLQDTDLSSIDRIEVIRGPGATMWGSNAVNGVINIITSKASATKGGAVDLVAGTIRDEATASYGGSLGEADYRAFVKYFDRQGYGQNNFDQWDMLRTGLRVDWTDGQANELFLSTEAFTGNIGENTTITFPTPPYTSFEDTHREVDGGFLLAGWSRTLSATSNFQMQMFYDRTSQDDVQPNETRDTAEIDFQHRFLAAPRHDLIWGASYRWSKDETSETFTFTLDPSSRTQRLLSAFIQDEIRLSGDELFLTVGTKVEQNNFSSNDLEWEPNVRLSWNVTEAQMLWASIARAVRVPSRVEQSATINGAVVPPGVPGNPFAVPFVLTVLGDPDLKTEEATAYELGYRYQIFEATRLDLALFYNQYEHTRTIIDRAPVCQPGAIPVVVNPVCFITAAYVSLPVQIANGDDIDSHGAELSMSHRMGPSWWLQGSYTYLYVDDAPGSTASAVSQDYPKNQLSLRSALNLKENAQFDLWLRYVDNLPAQDIGSYVTLDARASWSPVPPLEVALVGRNLLESRHAEFLQEFNESIPVEIEREAYLELRWKF